MLPGCQHRYFSPTLIAIMLLLISRLVGAQEQAPESIYTILSKKQIPTWIYAAEQTDDTLLFHEAFLHLVNEIDKQGDLDLKRLSILGHKALALSQTSRYTDGYIRVCREMGWAFIGKNQPDSSLYYHGVASKYARLIGDSALVAASTIGEAWTLLYYQQYERSDSLALDAVSTSIRLGDTSLLIQMLFRQARILHYNKKLLEAYKVCHQHESLCQKRADTVNLIQSLQLKEAIFSDMGLVKRQMDVVHQMLDLHPYIEEPLSRFTIIRTASRAFLLNAQYDSSLHYARLNLPYAAILRKLPLGYTHIARVHLETGQLDSAFYYYTLILQEHQRKGTYIDTDLWLDMGRIALLSHRYEQAFEFLKKAESEINKPRLDVQRDIYKALYTYYDQVGDIISAYPYLQKAQVTSDSLARFQNSYHAGISYLDQEMSEQQNQLQLLAKDNELQSALSERHRREKRIVLAGAMSILLLLGFGFYRFKKWRDLKQDEKLLRERLRISQDLHDEVGATMSGVTMYSHLVKTQLETQQLDAANKSVDVIQESTREMVNKLSDIVWLIHPNNDSLAKLFDKLEEYGQGLAQAKAYHVDFIVSPFKTHIPLPVETRRNIYLIFKEGINNAMKYSGAVLITLSAHYHAHTLCITLTDHGSGFKDTNHQSGNGLRNMEQRAKDIHCSYDLQSLPGHGTSIHLSLDLPQ